MTTIAIFLFCLALVVGLRFAGEYVVYKLAEKNLFWTLVAEGTSKSVVSKKLHVKSILSKKNHKLNEDWDVVPLDKGDSEPKSGLHWVGIYPFYQVYVRKMKFVKALSEKNEEGLLYERRGGKDDKEVDYLITGTQYQYALVFDGAEDSKKLHLSGQMTMSVKIINPFKALFLVHDWFDALVSRVLPRVRQYISENTYDDLINNPGVQLDVEVFKMLNQPGKGAEPRSIIKILKEDYGLDLVALETVSIDPPEEYRKTTLEAYQAEMDAKRDNIKRLGSTTGTLMSMIADQTGQKIEDVRAEFAKNPDVAIAKYKSLIEMNRSFIEQQLAADAGSLKRYYFQGGQGGMDLIALFGDMFRGGTPPNNADSTRSATTASAEKGDASGIKPERIEELERLAK